MLSQVALIITVVASDGLHARTAGATSMNDFFMRPLEKVLMSKVYRVSGVAFVPVSVVVCVSSESEESAMQRARHVFEGDRARRVSFIVPDSEENELVFDFQPSEASEILASE